MSTRLQESRILALFHALLDQLQGLLHVLRVNGILDLVVAPQKHRVIVGAHGDSFAQPRIGLFNPYLSQKLPIAVRSTACTETVRGYELNLSDRLQPTFLFGGE